MRRIRNSQRGRDKGRALPSTARAGCGRGREGRSVGRGKGSVAGGSRETHGCLTGGTGASRRRDGSLTDPGPRHEDARDVTPPPVFLMPRGSRQEARSQLATHVVADCELAPGRGPAGGRKCDVPGVFVTDRAEVWPLSHGDVTEVRPPPVPVTGPRPPHVPVTGPPGIRDEPLASPANLRTLGSSWGSQPARTPMRSPGPPSDGRKPPEPPKPDDPQARTGRGAPSGRSASRRRGSAAAPGRGRRAGGGRCRRRADRPLNARARESPATG